jgi:pimeloyl-ACP methyl ester carboxylesterase
LTAGARALCFASALILLGACAQAPPSLDLSSLSTDSPIELQEQVVTREPTFEVFASRGPFAVKVHENRELSLTAKERIPYDVFLADAKEEAPLVIFVHGHESSKGAHYGQAAHVASWGMHAIAVQLPAKGPWDVNGRTLARITSLIARSPQSVDGRIDVKRIILVGHSFGASAVGVALAQSAPAAGAILLDPAAIGKDVPDIFRRIDRPILVLGADDETDAPRGREYFFDFVFRNVAELSIRDADHDDAQGPARTAIPANDSNAAEDPQITFLSALTAAAISLSATGSFDYAWKSFARAFETGKFFNERKK